MTERTTLAEIDSSLPINVVTFSANGEHLVSGDDQAVRVWGVADGTEVGSMAAYDVRSIVVSRDDKFIAAGTELGNVTVWDAHTREKTFTHKENNGAIRAVDFSPDSTRLVFGSSNCTATVWDLAARKQMLALLHDQHGVVAAKYSPQGDRIATRTDAGRIRVYDGQSGELLIDIPANVAVSRNNGLVWSSGGQHLFAISDGKVKQIEVSTGAAVSEWPISDYQSYACLTSSTCGKFVVYSSDRTINLLDASTSKLGKVIQYDRIIHTMALSPDDLCLATVTEDRKISIISLQDTPTASPMSGPFIHVGGPVFESWKQDQLVNAEALLTQDIVPENPSFRALAHRALIRSRLQQWDAAKDDAQKSIDIQPSVIGLIAMSVALVGGGKKQEGYRAYDLAFKHCPSSRMDVLLAIKAVVACMAGEFADAISRVGDIIATAHENSIYYALQAYMYFLSGNSCLEHEDYEGAIQSFERAQMQMRHYDSRRLSTISLITGWQFDDLDITILRHLCEAFFAAGRGKQAEVVLLKIINSIPHKSSTTEPIIKWISGFIQRYLSTPESSGDAASEADRQQRAMTPNVPISSLGVSNFMLLLTEWTRVKMAGSSWQDVFAATVDFTVPKIIIYQAMCEHLEMTGRITDAADCFCQMDSKSELGTMQNEEAKWVLDFKQRCSRKLEDLGDTAMDARRHDEAISRYSAVLRLNPTTPEALLVKRSKAYAAMGCLEDALNDANEVIRLDPSSPLGHEMKHAALHLEGRYSDAVDAFKMMLLMISQSSDPDIRAGLCRYVKPEETEAKIREAVQDVICDLPRMLINTSSGRLLNKFKQASVFESLPVFTELVSSMTTDIDTTRIEHEVAQYYRYAAFSHTWEEGEPLFKDVARVVVYDLGQSSTHDKLQMFCKIARDAGFHWAWSDNCCIDKQDHVVLQEALVAMFKWYQGSALVIVFLRGVRSPSKRGDLVRSIWNTRAWTFQEYHAAKVVRFYTEDWKPYMNLDVPNHKESPEIIAEMEEATGISAQALRALRPDLNDMREKLSLASRRKATFVEDTAYALFGIFAVSLPVVYGERDNALGRLLAHLLASSGDTSIFAWTGKSGSFNSCLPADITVFSQLPTSHIPSAFKHTIPDMGATSSRTSVLSVTAATRLYDQLSNLPVPSVSGKRMRIPCITFKLGRPTRTSECAFLAKADALGIVEIVTTEDLLQFDSIYLVHPWIDFLLSRHAVGGGGDTFPECARTDEPLPSPPGPSNVTPVSQRTPTLRLRVPAVARLRSLGPRPTAKHTQDSASLASPSILSLTDKPTKVLQFIDCLRRPFGALVFTPTRHNVAEFRRVASDSMVTVQIRKNVPLDSLIPSVRMVDVL